MHDLALEILQAWYVGILGCIELADCGDKEVGYYGVKLANFCFLTTAFDDRPPFAVDVVPAGFGNGRIEADVLIELVFVGDGDQIVLYLFLAWVLARPVGIGLERVGIEVAQDCDVLVQYR